MRCASPLPRHWNWTLCASVRLDFTDIDPDSLSLARAETPALLAVPPWASFLGPHMRGVRNTEYRVQSTGHMSREHSSARRAWPAGLHNVMLHFRSGPSLRPRPAP